MPDGRREENKHKRKDRQTERTSSADKTQSLPITLSPSSVKEACESLLAINKELNLASENKLQQSKNSKKTGASTAPAPAVKPTLVLGMPINAAEPGPKTAPQSTADGEVTGPGDQPATQKAPKKKSKSRTGSSSREAESSVETDPPKPAVAPSEGTTTQASTKKSKSRAVSSSKDVDPAPVSEAAMHTLPSDDSDPFIPVQPRKAKEGKADDKPESKTEPAKVEEPAVLDSSSTVVVKSATTTRPALAARAVASAPQSSSNTSLDVTSTSAQKGAPSSSKSASKTEKPGSEKKSQDDSKESKLEPMVQYSLSTLPNLAPAPQPPASNTPQAPSPTVTTTTPQAQSHKRSQSLSSMQERDNARSYADMMKAKEDKPPVIQQPLQGQAAVNPPAAELPQVCTCFYGFSRISPGSLLHSYHRTVCALIARTHRCSLRSSRWPL